MTVAVGQRNDGVAITKFTVDPERMMRAPVPKDRQVALTEPEIAIEEIDRVSLSTEADELAGRFEVRS
ncbi:hypothetical protein NKH61_34605 [Mesorhizobium sp. M1005]|uniref:hypothetical protein n=1 Tax=unclassified Mesorhizobium TaxID=325217 RepID=UPI00333D0CED